MKTITIDELVNKTQPGDILLVAGKGLLSKGIRIFQGLQGDPAVYTHVAMFPLIVKNIPGGKYHSGGGLSNKMISVVDHEPHIIEANRTLDYKPLSQYIDYPICVIRNKDMTNEKYIEGFVEIANNIGQKYPYYRLGLHAIDNICNMILRWFHVKPKVFTTQWIKSDRPVCSEWIAQFLIKAGLILKKLAWGGVNPDDFHDLSLKEPETWITIVEAVLIS